jgi:hypothetical protein
VKTIIAGGRDVRLSARDFFRLSCLKRELPITEVVCGTAHGVDTDGEKWAKRRGLPVRKFYPDWNKHGRSAGPIRNTEMAAYAEALVAFPGGVGTNHMVEVATRLGLKVIDFRRSRQ